MGLFDKLKKVFSSENSHIPKKDQSVYHKNKEETYQYPLLLQKCSELYSALIKYEYCLCGIDGISFYRQMYEDIKDEMFLEFLEENKHNIFIKPQVIKELISCAKETYQLSKEEFLLALKEIFNIIAINEEYTAEFCYNYLSKELEQFVYQPAKTVNFSDIFDALLINRFSQEIENGLIDFKENMCPCCREKQSTILTRSKKCEKCGNKIYIVKIADKRIYCIEETQKNIVQVQSDNKQYLDFCYMALYAGCEAEDLEKLLQEGRFANIRDIAWRKLSEKRNNYYSQGQIDLLSRINLNMAKILIAEKKYKTALVFVCEVIYSDYSPIAFHPGFAHHKIDNQIKNVNESDAVRYNETHKPSWNKYAYELLCDIKTKIESEDFNNLLRQSFEECTHFYLSMQPSEIYNEVIKRI